MPCTQRCGLFGTPATEGLCSRCWASFLQTLPAAEAARRRDAATAAARGGPAGGGGAASREELAAIVRRIKPAAGEDEVEAHVATYLADRCTLVQVEAVLAAAAELSAKRAAFTGVLAARGFTVVPVEPFGNCLFGAVAHQVYGDEHLHGVVRAAAVAFMRALFERDGGAGAVACALKRDLAPLRGGVGAYLEEMERDKVWGDASMLRACADLYGREVCVWVSDGEGGAMPYPSVGGPPSPGGAVPALVLANYAGNAHFDSCEDATTLAHRLPPETAGEVEAAALERLRAGDGDGAAGGGGGGGGSQRRSPHGLLSSGASVEEHVRDGLLAAMLLRGASGEGGGTPRSGAAAGEAPTSKGAEGGDGAAP